MKKLMTLLLSTGLVVSLGCGEPAKKADPKKAEPAKKDEGKAPEKKDEKAPEAKTGEKEAKKP